MAAILGLLPVATPAQILRGIDAVARTDYLYQRQLDRVLGLLMPGNSLVVRVQLHTGLRVSDVLRLTFPLRTQCWITEGKTGKRRHIGLPQQLIDAIAADAAQYVPQHMRRYIWEAPPRGVTPLWAFPSPRDWRRHRTRQAVWRDIKRAALACRLPQNVGTHSARKCYAVGALRRADGDMGAVQRALNHSDIGITMIYAMADKMLADRQQQWPGERI